MSPEFTVRVVADGVATITAATKVEAERRARAGDFDSVRRWPWSAHISTLKRSSPAEPDRPRDSLGGSPPSEPEDR